MRFFEHQEQARKQTFRLLILFGLGVFALIFSIDGILLLGLGYSESQNNMQGANWGAILQTYFPALAIVAVFIGFVIGSASLYRLAQLSSGGGASVAESLGGILLQPDTRDPVEKKILNIVEEMAIASGVPIPRVYLMDEDGINAFAAGWSPADAVIGITRGSVEALSRDELQGVVAHEMAHVANRDTLVSAVAATTAGAIAIVSDMLIRMMWFGGRRDHNSNANPITVVISLVVMLMAPIAAILLKAAISRKRESLADATAVDFTRNPTGLRKALEILARDSTVVQQRSNAVAHIWIESPLDGKAVSKLFATHPPIEERIATLRKLEGNL